jgi:hypothetical protein
MDKIPEPNSEVVENVKYYLDRANQIMEKIGHPFAHRVYQAITQYVVNYPGVEILIQNPLSSLLRINLGRNYYPNCGE